MQEDRGYVGRYAPTPSGLLHKGHAATFAEVMLRARHHQGRVLLRIEDLDQDRCKRKYEDCVLEDLLWLGLTWESESLFRQSDRLCYYREALLKLIELGCVYPSTVSRKQINMFPGLRRNQEGESIFPVELREENLRSLQGLDVFRMNWRFCVTEGVSMSFVDRNVGKKTYTCLRDFGDFLVWTKAGYPSYELAVVLDDVCSGITEVVRGEDLILSTARQLLIYDVLGFVAPDFYHCPLVKDEYGIRLAKRFDSESIRSYRERGFSAADFWAMMGQNM